MIRLLAQGGNSHDQISPEDLEEFLIAITELFTGITEQIVDVLSFSLGAATGIAFIVAASMVWDR